MDNVNCNWEGKWQCREKLRLKQARRKLTKTEVYVPSQEEDPLYWSRANNTDYGRWWLFWRHKLRDQTGQYQEWATIMADRRFNIALIITAWEQQWSMTLLIVVEGRWHWLVSTMVQERAKGSCNQVISRLILTNCRVWPLELSREKVKTQLKVV